METQPLNQTSRNLVLIDIENLAAMPCPTVQDLEEVKAALRSAIDGFDQAHCIVACNHRAAKVVSFSFPKALRRWRSGRDGADLALVDEMSDLRVMKRYEQVTLCSGDGIFAPHVAALGLAGIAVTVISLEGHLARRLEFAAKNVVTLTKTDSVTPVAAVRRAS